MECCHCCAIFLKILFAILLPPLGVLLDRGCDKDFFITLLLTLLGYVPGIIYALYLIICSPKAGAEATGN